jgi:uracil phosphoribosyltransferase
MIKNLGKQNSIFNNFIAELRDASLQKDGMRFRRNLERIGEIAAYEISKTFPVENVDVVTSLGTATVPVIKDYPVLIPILRAGIPLHKGLENSLTARRVVLSQHTGRLKKMKNSRSTLNTFPAPI